MKKIIFAFAVVSGLLLTSCYKAPVDGTVKIIILDTNNFRLPAANINLAGPTGSNINVSGVSDFNGEWIYTHDPALEVILTATVSSQDGSMNGGGTVRIEPDKDATVTITLH